MLHVFQKQVFAGDHLHWSKKLLDSQIENYVGHFIVAILRQFWYLTPFCFQAIEEENSHAGKTHRCIGPMVVRTAV